ncbi:Subtilisin-like protease SBT2.5 [Rhynchospora pubera]|uniref:Subtilisin-like protease SBT2.5 n=1 Tax=Rhynchospora pubera TaxID=906938 RepID=A0AAV8BW82_9POAL|nr:Subtilisin-like protease SBT2.5 [Rhynchospora pubera]
MDAVSVTLSFLLAFLCLNSISFHAAAKVYMVILEEDAIISYKSTRPNHIIRGHEARKYKENVIIRHDLFLESLLPTGTYTKLYSYTHLINGFALHTTSDTALKILDGAMGVRMIQEDIKLTKLTTHTPDYVGVSNYVWPYLGGAERAGEGVLVGMIDTGINPSHPSFTNNGTFRRLSHFKGRCEEGYGFPLSACNGKIVGAQLFARAAIAAGDFNATRDYASPLDSDGHGSHTASIAVGNFRTPVLSKGYNYGNASGMAPGARLAIYKALFPFGGYMSDVVAAIDKAVEDGVDIISMSIGPSSVPPGPSSFLSILEIELLFATKAGVSVIQAVGNSGPDPNSILSFSPWITSVAASGTDRMYKNSIILGNGRVLSGIGISKPTAERQIATKADVSSPNASANCLDTESLIPSLARGKLIICEHIPHSMYGQTTISTIFESIGRIGAAGVIITSEENLLDSDAGAESSMTLPVPGIVLGSVADSQELRDYYNSNTLRSTTGEVIRFVAVGSILDGRRATYTEKGPIVALYSSRGPDVNNNLMEAADVLKPSLMAPGSAIWGAWSPNSQSVPESIGEDFTMLSGTSMAAPHVTGIAALIKQKHPDWSPAAITSAMMTTADRTDHFGNPILAQTPDGLRTANPFDYGAGAINAARAMNPGLIFDIQFENYVQFLYTVPGVDKGSVRQAVGVGNCPTVLMRWCSDLNTPSVTIANLVGSRRVMRRVTSVSTETEIYVALVKEPAGISVRVTPRVIRIGPNESRGFSIKLEAREVTNAFTFGTVVLRGNKKHTVRIPLAVFASSAL